MYPGEILVGVGIASLVLFALLVVYLIYSRKRNRLYQEILLQEATSFEAFTSTVQIIREKTSSVSVHVEADSIHSSSSVSAGHIDGTVLEDQEGGLMAFQRTGHVFSSKDATVLDDGEITSGLFNLRHASGVDWSPLEEQYEYIEEIKGGGMGKVFKALKLNTGNEWIVKFIPKNIGKLTQEADILKELNHVNLPSIIDIFESGEGQFLVETFVEGVSMDQVFETYKHLPVFKVLDWAEQMAQVLSYLHNMDEPFLHLDLKPGNIMVTHDDKLVLIDFGISKRQSDVSGSVGATLKYCAPEQVQSKLAGKSKDIIDYRFGEFLPQDRKEWTLDVRSDIYSLGVILFEAATGTIPRHKDLSELRRYLPTALCEVIYKCLEIQQADRYQSIDELLSDIQQQKQQSKSKMQFALMSRKAAGFGTVAAVVLAVLGFTMGFYLMDVEARTIMTIDPAILTVSVLQSSEIRLTRLLPYTPGYYQERPLNENNLRWELTASEVAQVDGNRVIGLNIGETIIHGLYRHNNVTMQVQVVEPMDGIVEISQRYPAGNEVFLFAGTTHRERVDGLLANVEFVGPGSMDIAESGAIYLVDSGILRRIYKGATETIEINPPFLVPNIIRTYGNDVFILTEPWYDSGRFYFGIIRLAEGGGEGFFLGDAQNTDIRDFVIDNGLIYFIEWNAGWNRAFLRAINVNNADDIRDIIEVPDGISALSIGNGQVFLADSEQGSLLVYETGQLIHLAGATGERAFIDGAAPLFYQPSRIRYNDSRLYIWDFNVLRKLRLEDGRALEAVSLAGAVSPVYDIEFKSGREPAERIIFPYSRLMDFIVLNGEEVLLTDPKRGVIWKQKILNKTATF